MDLHLVIKHVWFDLIAEGEKRFEQRKKTSYWIKRIICRGYGKGDKITFHRGFTSVTLSFIVTNIEVTESFIYIYFE